MTKPDGKKYDSPPRKSADNITLPAERVKNGRAHTLTLPKMAIDIIASVPRVVDRDYLLGVRSRGFRSWQTQKARFKDCIANPWKLHDLRRSVATGMCEIGIEPPIVEAILNHAGGHKGGVAGIYNRAQYATQMKNALLRWANSAQSSAEARTMSWIFHNQHDLLKIFLNLI